MSLARLAVASLTVGVLGGFVAALLRPRRGRPELTVRVSGEPLSVKISITAAGAIG